MSTRANIIIKDSSDTLYFYRHSDGYPRCTGEDLTEFVKDYTSGAMRTSVTQSAGWLIVRGHFEYKGASIGPVNDEGDKVWADEPDRTGPRANMEDRFSGWKVGAYEPTTELHGDVEYIYIIDLDKMELSCRKPNSKYWDKPSLKNTTASTEFATVKFACGKDAI